MMDIPLYILVLDSNTWNNLTVCKKEIEILIIIKMYANKWALVCF